MTATYLLAPVQDQFILAAISIWLLHSPVWLLASQGPQGPTTVDISDRSCHSQMGREAQLTKHGEYKTQSDASGLQPAVKFVVEKPRTPSPDCWAAVKIPFVSPRSGFPTLLYNDSLLPTFGLGDSRSEGSGSCNSWSNSGSRGHYRDL